MKFAANLNLKGHHFFFTHPVQGKQMTNDHYMHVHGSHFDSHKPFRDLGHRIWAFGEYMKNYEN